MGEGDGEDGIITATRVTRAAMLKSNPASHTSSLCKDTGRAMT